MNRQIDAMQLQNSKNRNIGAVIESIDLRQKTFVFKPKYALVFGVFVVAIAIGFLIDFGKTNNTVPIVNNNTIVLNEATTETLVELSYMSASLMASSFSVSNGGYIQLVQPIKKTSIEANIDEVNSYFEMLKIFLEENPFENNIVVENLVDEEYQNKISFTSDGNNFQFYITIMEEDIEGILYIEDEMYLVTGKQILEETESKLQLRAINGANYVEVEYIIDESDLETTKKYNVESFINNIETEKNIKITIEDGSYKVTIEDLTSKYNLKKNTEDDEGKFRLDYIVDGEMGRATIYEDVDDLGNPVYRYEIREANVTATILVPRTSTQAEQQQYQIPSKMKKEKSIL